MISPSFPKSVVDRLTAGRRARKRAEAIQAIAAAADLLRPHSDSGVLSAIEADSSEPEHGKYCAGHAHYLVQTFDGKFPPT